MRQYVRWFWRRFFRHRKAPVKREIPVLVHPRAVQPPVPASGFDLEELRENFAAISINGGKPGELAGYARQDLERFLRTVDLVPKGVRKGLEIGATPYFTTLLLRWLRPEIGWELTNFFNEYTDRIERHTVTIKGPEDMEVHDFYYRLLNVEDTKFPYADGQLDLVLYCEVLEHMTNDPLAALLEIRRVLQPGGYLVLTTPNAARLDSAARLIAGLNVYDQYSGHGPYGRHNREYTVNEVQALLTHCGFEEERIYTADVYDNHAALHVANPEWLAQICGPRRDLLGQYIFSCWRRGDGEPAEGRPSWLYRSLPAGALSSQVPLTEPPGARW